MQPVSQKSNNRHEQHFTSFWDLIVSARLRFHPCLNCFRLVNWVESQPGLKVSLGWKSAWVESQPGLKVSLGWKSAWVESQPGLKTPHVISPSIDQLINTVITNTYWCRMAFQVAINFSQIQQVTRWKESSFSPGSIQDWCRMTLDWTQDD